jgi:hypothetical protein
MFNLKIVSIQFISMDKMLERYCVRSDFCTPNVVGVEIANV